MWCLKNEVIYCSRPISNSAVSTKLCIWDFVTKQWHGVIFFLLTLSSTLLPFLGDKDSISFPDGSIILKNRGIYLCVDSGLLHVTLKLLALMQLTLQKLERVTASKFQSANHRGGGSKLSIKFPCVRPTLLKEALW